MLIHIHIPYLEELVWFKQYFISLSNLHELHLQTIRLGNKPMAYINPSLNNLTLCERYLNNLIHVHAHNMYKLLFFQILSLPYKQIHYTLAHGIYTYFSLTWN